jgi:hypothetical protein
MKSYHSVRNNWSRDIRGSLALKSKVKDGVGVQPPFQHVHAVLLSLSGEAVTSGPRLLATDPRIGYPPCNSFNSAHLAFYVQIKCLQRYCCDNNAVLIGV